MTTCDSGGNQVEIILRHAEESRGSRQASDFARDGHANAPWPFGPIGSYLPDRTPGPPTTQVVSRLASWTGSVSVNGVPSTRSTGRPSPDRRSWASRPSWRPSRRPSRRAREPRRQAQRPGPRESCSRPCRYRRPLRHRTRAS